MAGEHHGDCPTACDADCDAPCHEVHQVTRRRDHQPEQCPSTGDRGDTLTGAWREACPSFVPGPPHPFGDFCATCGLSDMDHLPFDEIVELLIDAEEERRG